MLMNHLLIRGNALRIPLADQSVHCVVTSPPYWGLRDYGTAAWEGGDEGCDHLAVATGPTQNKGCNNSKAAPFLYDCRKCGARRIDQQLGLEATPDQYIATMVQVFREVRRVLRDDGTCWVNMGDSYNGGGAAGTATAFDKPDKITGGRNRQARNHGTLALIGRKNEVDTLKPKDLCGIPWRLALALQADGWYLRSDIIWSKPNPMPESVTDRPTKSHEYIFLLTKRERYYFDQEAVREAHQDSEREANRPSRRKNMKKAVDNGYSTYHIREDQPSMDRPMAGHVNGRNIRSVWSIPTESYVGAHFATFPRKLVEPCILAGTSERGCCPQCGVGWEREVESERVATRPGGGSKVWIDNPGDPHAMHNGSVIGNRDPFRHVSTKTTTGWHPTCAHDAEPVPCTVFDPFAGSGTTGVVALAHGRRFIGLDLSAEYLGLATKRITRPHQRIARPGKVEHHPLFDDVPVYYECKDCGITLRINELVSGCPKCGQTMTPAECEQIRRSQP